MSALASLLDSLPAPKNAVTPKKTETARSLQESKTESISENQKPAQPAYTVNIPTYGNRKGWIPRKQEDFGDGGAFPEIHVAQYPLGLGFKKSTSSGTSSSIVLAEDVSKRGQREDKIVYSKFTDLIEKNTDEMNLSKPSEEEEDELANKTKNALEKIVNSKIATAYKAGPQHQKQAQDDSKEPLFYRYTPQGSQETRIIKAEEAAIDPLEPPRFQNKKIQRGPPSPPVPVMHSPERKLTKDEAAAWYIPPSISNYKNPKGFTIPLDKRLAADGRNLQEVAINENFPAFMEALYTAENVARTEIEMKAKYEKLKLIKEKEAREEQLRKLAQEARTANQAEDSESESETDEEEEERNQLREERRIEREYERRRQAYKKKSKNQRDEDRDVSEKYALGQAARPSLLEADVDSRLYNMNSGLDQGFGTEDSYDVYDKPLLKGSSASQIYQPRNVNDGDVDSLLQNSNKFVTEKTKEKQSSRTNGPVQFEREKPQEELRPPSSSSSKGSSEKSKAEADPFGFNKFLTDTKNSSKKAFDHIGKKGMMSASAGSGSGRDSESMSKRSRIEFESSGKGSTSKKQRQ